MTRSSVGYVHGLSDVRSTYLLPVVRSVDLVLLFTSEATKPSLK